MKTITAKDFNFSSVMIDTTFVLPVIKTEDIQHKQPIYLVLRKTFEEANDDDEIPLGFAKIVNRQIRLENEQNLMTVDGLYEKKKNLTLIF